MMKYDYLIVGSGLYGATFAYCATKAGKKCLIIDKRRQLGGNVYCENIEGINVHKYGAHIFHTSNKEVWDFVNSIVEFNRYTNSPVANYKGELYNLPFNMNTFNKMWPDVHTPAQAMERIREQASPDPSHREEFVPQNLEEQAISLVGVDIYRKLIKDYTEKQWGRDCKDLPAFIIKRLPLRFTYDNNYFNDKYQGIPVGGYNKLIEGLLSLSNPSHKGAYVLVNEDVEGGLVDTLVGIDLPLNKATRCLNHDEGGYPEMSASMNYELLKDNAKRMRKEPTEAESAFWKLVSEKSLGVKFSRQHIIGNYIVDFVCLEKKLIVELDGGYHFTEEQVIVDNMRSKELKEYGFTILRLKNEEVLFETDATIDKLKLAMWLSEKAPLREGFGEAADKLVYTGAIDEYFDYKLGKLDWRTVSFKTRIEDTPNYQGNAVINYTSHDEPFTRVIEHKHFEMFGQEVYDCPKTVVSEEYSCEYDPDGTKASSTGGGLVGAEPYYPVNDDRNNTLFEEYRKLAHNEGIIFSEELSSLPMEEGWEGAHVLFGGRLGQYKYYDMAPVIEQVLKIKNI